MFSIFLELPKKPESNKRSNTKDGLTFREPLTGNTRHIPQFDLDNEWFDRPDHNSNENHRE